MAKKIEGWALSKKEWCGSGVLASADFALFQDTKEHQACTLVIHDGPSERVWTESEVRAMRWIPVAEQLPEMVPDGIGWSKSEEVLAMYIDADIRYCKVAYCRTTPEGHIQWIGIKATHWMPLPEAP